MSSVQQHSKMIVRVALIILILFFSISCSTFSTKKNDEKNLLVFIEAFNSALRWEDYKAAAAWIAPPLREEFWKQTDAFQGRIRLMDYQIRNISLENEGFSGTVLLRFRYYFVDDPQVQTKMLHQKWRYLEKEKVWQLVQYDLWSLMAGRQ